MVPYAFGSPSSSTATGGSTEGADGPGTPPSVLEQPETTRLENVWRQHAAIGVLQTTSELLLAGWSRGTNKAYQSGWIGWCQGREIDP